MIVAALATMPSRSHTLPITVASILPQVDYLYVYLNDYKTLPDCLNDPKVMPTFGNIGSRGKFYFSKELKRSGCLLTIDDDIQYPSDYAERMSKKVIGSGTVVGVHGHRFTTPTPNDYFGDSKAIHFQADTIGGELHILGTGTIAFDLSHFVPTIEEIVDNSLDLSVAVACKKRQIPMIAIERSRNWLIGIDELQPDSIYRRWQEFQAYRNETIKANWPWKLLEEI